MTAVTTAKFSLITTAVAAAIMLIAHFIGVDYLYFASYTILQFVVLATAWNILGGYCGYVNFGSAAFFAMGAYASVFMHKFYPVPIPLLIVIGALVSGIAGLGMGYLTLRLRGSFTATPEVAADAFRAGEADLKLEDGTGYRVMIVGHSTGSNVAYFEMRI